MVDPKKIPAAEGHLDIGTVDQMRERAAEYRGQADGIEQAEADVLGPPEDFGDLEDADGPPPGA